MNAIRETFPLQEDVLNGVPPLPDTKLLEEPPYAGFAFSQQGASHRKKDRPCQDRCDIRYLADSHIVLAAVADGVGSCPLSHWGAYYAVKTVLDELEHNFLNNARGNLITQNIEINDWFDSAFKVARHKVEALADKVGRPVSQFESTLTVAVYVQDKLYCCHVGDDGIVAQFTDGTVEMVTPRMKGEDASSVYPLQTGEWKVIEVKKPVAGFVMATDGVLDHFVKQPEQIDYFHAVYYPFMQSALYGPLQKGVVATAKAYRDTMNQPSYQAKVEDDLTFVSIVNLRVLDKSQKPQFEKNLWNEAQDRWQRKVNAALYGTASHRPKQETVEPTQKKKEPIPQPAPQKENVPSASTLYRKPKQLKTFVLTDDGRIEISLKINTVLTVAVVLCILFLLSWGVGQIRAFFTTRQEMQTVASSSVELIESDPAQDQTKEPSVDQQQAEVPEPAVTDPTTQPTPQGEQSPQSSDPATDLTPEEDGLDPNQHPAEQPGDLSEEGGASPNETETVPVDMVNKAVSRAGINVVSNRIPT